MRHLSWIPMAALAPLAAACGQVAPSASHALATGSVASAEVQGDQADTGCQVVLRSAGVGEAAAPEVDCSSGTCWALVTVTFDVATAQDQNQAEAWVLYQGASEGSSWQQQVAAPIVGAPMGYRRYQATLRNNTFAVGQAAAVVQLIPYLYEYIGARLFDHNAIADPLGAYQLTAANGWSVTNPATVCAAAAPAGVATLTFAAGWENSESGSLVQGGKLDVGYDISRLPDGSSCTPDGVVAYDVMGFVQFQPDGTVSSEQVNGPLYGVFGAPFSLPLEFDVPAGATSAALWFFESNDCGSNAWDSNFSQNYVYPVAR